MERLLLLDECLGNLLLLVRCFVLLLLGLLRLLFVERGLAFGVELDGGVCLRRAQVVSVCRRRIPGMVLADTRRTADERVPAEFTLALLHTHNGHQKHQGGAKLAR